MEENTKIQTGAGVFLAVFVAVCILLVTFGWAPTKYLLGKWDGFWENLDQTITRIEVNNTSTIRYTNYEKAEEDCKERGNTYFGQENYTYVKDTGGKGEYDQYECYGFRTTKLSASLNKKD